VPSEAAARIRLRRQQLGMTQAQLAAAVGVHVATVTSWEAGTFPSRHQGKVEAVLGISLNTAPDPVEEAVRAISELEWLTPDDKQALIAEYRQRHRPHRAAG
jgi:transcriptional regulator with XRE-family HTH domain